ncbi:MAG: MG2 domain-containing protein, partial [Burkholderiaceae bacterium]
MCWSPAWAVKVSKFTPQGTVSKIESVQLAFDTAVIAFGDGQARAPVDLVCDDPAVQGQGRWLDAKRWTYVFKEAPGPGVHCKAQLRADFRGLNNETVSGKTQFSFQTGGPAVVSSYPYGSIIAEDQVFVLRFNGAVDPDSLVASTRCLVEGLGEAVPVRLVSGEDRKDILKSVYYSMSDEWDTPATQLLQCKRRLPAEAQVQLAVGPGVATPAAQGRPAVAAAKAEAFDYTVRDPFTAGFSCMRENASMPCTPVSPLTLGFSAPIAREDAARIRLKTPSGERGPDIRDTDYQGGLTSVQFDGPFAELSPMSLSLPQGLKDDSGRELANADQFPLSIQTAAFPPLVKFAAAPFGVIERFAHLPPGGSEANAPATVPLSLRNVEAKLRTRDLTVSAGKISDYVTRDDKEVLHWYARLRRLEDGNWTAKQLQDIMADRAPRGGERHDVPRLDTRGYSALQGAQAARQLTLPGMDGDNPRPFEVIGVPLAEPGFHVLEVESARLGQSLLASDKPMYVRSSALLTNLGVHLKKGRDDVLVWVTTLDDGKVVADADVAVLDCSGAELARGKTDDNGIWHQRGQLNAPDYCQDTGLGGLYASARIGADHALARGKADFSFVFSDWNRGIESWRFNVPVDTSPVPSVATHTVFDRTLLRAGETVSMKHFLRVQTRDGLALPPDMSELPTKLIIEHQGSDQRYEQKLAWTKTPSGGLAAASRFAIPKTARLGVYSVMLSDEHGAWYPSSQFRVEEFKLPLLSGTLKISNEADGGLLLAPSSLDADVQIAYVSGGPAGNLPVRVSGVLRDRWVHFADYEDYSFDPPDQRGDGMYDEEAGGEREQQTLFLDKRPLQLDGQGGGRLKIDGLPAFKRPGELVFEASFPDPNGEIQTLAQSLPVWPAAIQAGIRAGSWVEAGTATTVRGLALSTAGQPQAGVAMTITALARSTYSTRKRLVGGFYSYDNHVQLRDLGTVCKGTTNADGVLECPVQLKDAGAIQLRATASDAQGRTSAAEATVWVTGAGELWFGGRDDDRMDIIPERKNWKPGETAQFQVRMPFRHATALVAVEREGVLKTQVVNLDGSDPTVRIPIEAEWGPNVYVSVLALRGRLHEVPWYSFFTWGWQQPKAWYGAFVDAGKHYAAPTPFIDLSKPSFRYGLTQIRVSDERDRLDVKVSADKPVYQLRERAAVTVEVKTADGKPAAHGTVAFAAVDQALLELAPNDSWDLLSALRQLRSYGVETATAQMEVVGRRHYGRKALPAGGGGGKSPTRELLDTLLLWAPSVQLDAQGKATISVPLNDSITRYKLVAVADYGADRFGTGYASIASTQDLQLIPGLPALVREGDKYQAMVTLRNATAAAMRVKVTAGYAGKGVAPETLAPQEVELAPAAARMLTWDVQAPEANWLDGSAQLEWRIEAQDISGGAGDGGSTQADKKSKVARDALAFKQVLLPVVPVATRQATLFPLDADANPVRLPVQAPEGSLTDANGVPRGGLQVHAQSSLAGGLPGVRAWFEAYPYTCLEQLGSKAMGLRDAGQWQDLMRRLPTYLDDDGLAGYFPGASQGSEVLTAYLLAVSHEARALGLSYAIPEAARASMTRGLLAFAQGKL